MDLGTAEAIHVRGTSLQFQLTLTLSNASILGSNLWTLLGRVTLLVAVTALLVEQKWANHFAVRTRTILDIVALILLLGPTCVIAYLAERCLGSSLVAGVAAGAVIAARVVLSDCVHVRCVES